jgi:GNAT superfamily N-acetyltransferase
MWPLDLHLSLADNTHMRKVHSSNVVLRLWSSFRRYGLKGTISKILTVARKRIYLDETHVWYKLSLATDRAHVARLPGLSLIQASVRDLPLLDQLPSIDPYEGRRRMEAGHDLWLVMKGQQPVFACWVFHGSVPVIAARQGHIALPPEIVVFEDSVSSLAYRGRGIGIAAWPKIADRLRQTAATTVLTKVEEDNMAARRAFLKSGFREISTMHFQRRGPWKGLTIQVENGATASWLAEQLTH